MAGVPGACGARATVEVELMGALRAGEGDIDVLVVGAAEMVLAVGTARTLATLGTTLAVGAVVTVAAPLIAVGSVVGLLEEEGEAVMRAALGATVPARGAAVPVEVALGSVVGLEEEERDAVMGTAGAASAAAMVGSMVGLVVAGVAVVLASKGSQTPDAMLTNRQMKASMSRGRHHGCRLEIDIVMYNAVTNLSHAVVQPHRGSLEPDRPVPLAEQWLRQLLQVRKCLRIAAHHMRMRNLQCRGDRDHRRPARG